MLLEPDYDSEHGFVRIGDPMAIRPVHIDPRFANVRTEQGDTIFDTIKLGLCHVGVICGIQYKLVPANAPGCRVRWFPLGRYDIGRKLGIHSALGANFGGPDCYISSYGHNGLPHRWFVCIRLFMHEYLHAHKWEHDNDGTSMMHPAAGAPIVAPDSLEGIRRHGLLGYNLRQVAWWRQIKSQLYRPGGKMSPPLDCGWLEIKRQKV